METAHGAEMVLPVMRLTPYLRVRIRTDDAAITIRDRRSLFLFVPLRRRRIVVPLAELASGTVKGFVRVDCLVAACALGVVIVLLGLPIAVEIPLGVVGLLLIAVSITKALRVERTDGRAWTFPFCRDYAFDASLAILDAEGRRDADPMKSRGDPSESGRTIP